MIRRIYPAIFPALTGLRLSFDLKSISLLLILCALVFEAGCSVWSPNRQSPEYLAARDEIENGGSGWVRPEGARAAKRKRSIVPQAMANLPIIGEPKVDQDGAKNKFKEAEQIFDQAKAAEESERAALYRKAAKKFEDAGNDWRSSYIHQDGLMMAAESLFFAEEYPEAIEMYDLLVKEYPRSPYESRIEFRRNEIANYWMEYDDVSPQSFWKINLFDDKRPLNDLKGHSKRVFNKSRLDNPTGEYADYATMKLGNASFKEGDYKSAADHYEDLRLTHPDSEYQFEAHFLGLKATMMTYEGPDYTDGPLVESEKLIKQMFQQFPAQSREQKEYLNREYARIRYHRAEKLWTNASHWLKTTEHGSAKIYLQELVDEYPDTPFADQAKAELQRVSPLPDKEQKQLQILTRIFPSRDKVEPVLRQADKNNAASALNPNR